MKRKISLILLILMLMTGASACSVKLPNLSFTPNNPTQNNPNPDDNDPDGSNPVNPNPDGNDPDGSDPVNPNPDGNDPDGSDPVDPNPDGNDPDGSDPVDPNPDDKDPENPTPDYSNNTELQVIAIEMRSQYGDSFLIKYGDFEMLVDAGQPGDGEYVQAALKEFVTDKELDVLMVSHLHADHIGNMKSTSFFDSLNITIKTIVDPNTKADNTTKRNYVAMRDTFVSRGTKFYSYYDIIKDPSIDTKWFIDETKNVFIEFIESATLPTPEKVPSGDFNDSSIVFTLNYLNNKWFFAGDLTDDHESELVANMKKLETNGEDYFKESDYVVYKSCHHGSNGSNGHTLLSYVKPDMIFVMAGIVSDNKGTGSFKDQHPYSGALARMKTYTDKIYWSSINGLSIFSSKGNEVSFTARGRTVDYYYNGQIVSREAEKLVTIFESKWYLKMN